ncbi:uncharacterized protein PRCAT00000561001 [Priceomyces carsonii]|uniref:uncharacterized protein n=1 Tax=Priceomyces carsonii TaxID=28549 RepID=UPI002ED9C861|nr:unnamed protein product [Priceomyces carsonii]
MSVANDNLKKIDLITKGLQEYLNIQIIKDVIEKEKRPVKIYWGTAPTGKPHCGYFVPMIHLAYFLKAGCEVKVLVADLHAFLDNMKAPLEVVKYRAKYYELTVKAILKSINVPIEKLQFVVGSSYQLSENYTLDLFRLSNIVSQNDAKRAGADVVKQVANPLLSGLIYPLMQALDEEYLDVDAQFGGIDQRKIFVLAEENLPNLGFKKRAHLMNPMVPGLGQGGKMSASDPNSKIDILEEPKQVKKKINSAYCAPGELNENGLITFAEKVVQPIQELVSEKDGIFSLPIDRPEKYGGPITYDSIELLKSDFESGKLSPVDLKTGISDRIIELLAPIRKDFESNEEFQEAKAKGYPEVAPKQEKKAKKVKNKGTMYPGASKQDTTTEVSKALESTQLE